MKKIVFGELLVVAVLGFLLLATNVIKDREGSGEKSFRPGQKWLDDAGNPINAHGGGILQGHKKYYWFGEKRGVSASEGVNVYASSDLYSWHYEGVALPLITGDSLHEIATGCKIERPKVLYNRSTKQYVMWFHLEFRNKGYATARAAVAVSDKVTGPYRYVKSFRPNGNMSRDMTLFQDEDDAAYLIYSSRDNYDLRLVRLTDDYQDVTQQDSLLFSEHREAPAIFRKDNQYYMITSGCTGWKSNAASLHISASLWGPWKRFESPLQGEHAEITYDGQSTFILPVKDGSFIFMADRWNPKNLYESTYLWLPVMFENNLPVIRWYDTWSLDQFGKAPEY